MSKKIILASASPRRRELLEQIGIQFEVDAVSGEEIYLSEIPSEIVKELALNKAENTARKRQSKNELIIGADTIVVMDGKILGKPKDEREAYEMLSGLQGRSHEVYTGTAVLEFDQNGAKKVQTHAERTKVFVHEMNEEELNAYISCGEPMDKAGAYGIQGRFAAFIDRIEGDYYNVVGLPLAYVYQCLKES